MGPLCTLPVTFINVRIVNGIYKFVVCGYLKKKLFRVVSISHYSCVKTVSTEIKLLGGLSAGGCLCCRELVCCIYIAYLLFSYQMDMLIGLPATTE